MIAHGVELTRKRHRVATALCLASFALLLSCSWDERGADSLVPWSLCLISGLAGLTLLVKSFIPFRFHIGPVRETGLKVAEAMSRFGGERFTDDRLYKITPANFAITEGGWQQEAVGAVLEKCLTALESPDAKERLTLIAEIDTARHAFPTARRGFLPHHVNLYLDSVLAELAKPEPEREAAVED